MSPSASKGGVRLLAACAAINLTLAALGWLWLGRYVSTALVDKVARGGALTLGSWNWNSIHVVLWSLWLSGWFAFLVARAQSDKAKGPDLHKPAMTVAAAGSAGSLVWVWALWEVAQRLGELDAGRLASGSATVGLLAWTGLSLAIGAGVAIFVAALVSRWRFPEPENAPIDAGAGRTADVGAASVRSVARDATKKSPATPQSALRSLQLGTAVVSLAAFGLFWQFIAFGPAETTWSLDRLFSGPAAEGRAALVFLFVAHAAHVASGALTAFDRGEENRSVEPKDDAERPENVPAVEPDAASGD